MAQPVSNIVIAGWAHTRFGKLEDEDLASLSGAAVQGALQHAGLAGNDIDEVYFSQFNAGLTDLAFPSALPTLADAGLRFAPTTRVENACASGSAAVHSGVRAIESGRADRVLVVGAEKMTHRSTAEVGEALIGADFDAAGTRVAGGFAGLFADVADAYAERYGDPALALATIASKAHELGARNPLAHLRKVLPLEFCLNESPRNPTVAGLLKRSDCSPISDGAAALVLTRDSAAPDGHRRARVTGIGQASDHPSGAVRDPLEFRAAGIAWRRALDSAGVGLFDLDAIELHDCFTIAELNLYEVLGIVPRGQGRRALSEGTVLEGGALPVNLSGGLKSKGHPVGATGVSQHVIAAMQVTGGFPGAQLPDAERIGVFNMGGLAVANYASVIARA